MNSIGYGMKCLTEMHYWLREGTEIARHNTDRHMWEVFVTTKNAYYTPEDIFIRGKLFAYVLISDKEFDKIEIKVDDLHQIESYK